MKITRDGVTLRCRLYVIKGVNICPVGVGDQGIRYRNYIIGDHVYRGDSYPCAAAYHHFVNSHKEKNQYEEEEYLIMQRMLKINKLSSETFFD